MNLRRTALSGARWISTTAALAFAAAIFVTAWRVWLWGVTPQFMLSFEYGRVEVRTSETPSHGEWWNPQMLGHLVGPIQPCGLRWLRWDFEDGGDQYGRVVAIPMWTVAALVAAIAAPLWTLHLRARHRARVGLCKGCGYDRKGLAIDAKCPECGRT